MAAIVIIEFFIRVGLVESTMCKTSSKTTFQYVIMHYWIARAILTSRCYFATMGAVALCLSSVVSDDDDKAIGLLSALEHEHAEHVTAEVMDTDHGFNDHRIALQAAVVRWLTSLTGAPMSGAR